MTSALTFTATTTDEDPMELEPLDVLDEPHESRAPDERRKALLTDISQEAGRSMYAGLSVVLNGLTYQHLATAKRVLGANPDKAKLIALAVEIGDAFDAFRPDLANDDDTRMLLSGGADVLCPRCGRNVNAAVLFWPDRATATCFYCYLNIEAPMDMPGPTDREGGMLWVDARLVAFLRRKYPGNEALLTLATQLEDTSKSVALEASKEEYGEAHLWSLWFDVDHEGRAERPILYELAEALWEGVVQPRLSVRVPVFRGVTVGDDPYVRAPKQIGGAGWITGGYAPVPDMVAHFISRQADTGGLVKGPGLLPTRQLALELPEPRSQLNLTSARDFLIMTAMVVTAEPDMTPVEATAEQVWKLFFEETPRQRDLDAFGDSLRFLFNTHFVGEDGLRRRPLDLNPPDGKIDKETLIRWRLGLGVAMPEKGSPMHPYRGWFLVNVRGLLGLGFNQPMAIRAYIYVADRFNDFRTAESKKFDTTLRELTRVTNSYSPKAEGGTGNPASIKADHKRMGKGIDRLHDEGLIKVERWGKNRNQRIELAAPANLKVAWAEHRARGKRKQSG